MLDGVLVGGLVRLLLEETADSVEEDGDVVAHPGNLNVLPVNAASKGRTAYSAGRSDL
jgi:hypothetical protein